MWEPFFAGPAVVSDRLKGVLASPSCPRFDLALGTELAEAFMPSKMQHVLGQELTSAPGHLVIIHDGASAAVPWEAAFIDGKSLALGVGVSRKHRSETRSMPAKRPQRAAPPSDGRLRMLLIFDPTCDLKGTETEAHDLIELFNKKNCSIKALKREECTKEAILAELRGATYDLLHFAGHGMFTRQDPENSGIVLAGGKVFCASDLEGLPAVPRLIVLNAC